MAEDEIEDLNAHNEEEFNPFEKAKVDDKIIPLNGL